MNHQWYTNADGSQKTHRRPKSCAICRENPKGGSCALPFRIKRKVRWLAKMDKKPHFFKWTWLKYMRANEKPTSIPED